MQGGGAATASPAARVLFVRHGKQIRSGSRETERDRCDPQLSTQGTQQAELLARHLSAEEAAAAAASGAGDSACICVTSPMRRALMTAVPTATAMGCRLVCHGGLFEYGNAGLAQPGSTPDELRADCAELEFVGFSATGHWDYQGTAQKENEPDARLRAGRFAEWLQADLLSSHRPLTIVFAHQTYLDLVLRLLLEPETGAVSWSYGSNKHKFRHTACAELEFATTIGATAGGGGTPLWQLIRENDARHLERFDEVMKEASKAFD